MEEFDCIHWGPVSRREIDVRVNIASTPQTKINELSEATFRGSQNRKVLVYTNDKAAAKTTVLSGLEKSAAALSGRLANPGYVDKAPAHLVAETRETLASTQADLEQARAALAEVASS